MRYATIESGRVVAISELAGEVIQSDMVAISEGVTVEIGYLFDGTNYTAPTPAPAPTHRTRLTRLEFRNLFTQAEKQALYTAAQSSVDVQIYLDDVNAAQYIETTDQTTIDGLNALATAGILTQARADEILEGMPV